MSTYFISHTTADQPFVEAKIISLLKELRIDYFYCKSDIQTAAQWERVIRRELISCDGLILIMSPEAARSEWVKNELHWAWDRKPGRIIPVMYKQCERSDFHLGLPRLQSADFYDNEISGLCRLAGILKEFEPGTTTRMNSINGDWNGMLQQNNLEHGRPLIYPVSLKLHVSNSGKFSGVVSAIWDDRTVPFKVEGGFSFERFVTFSYHSEDYGSIQFGTVILELSPSGKELHGKVVGYGAISKTIISGEISFQKAPQPDTDR